MMWVLPKQVLLCVGQLPKAHRYVDLGWQHYAKLLKPYVANLECLEVPEAPATASLPINQVLATEAQRLQPHWQAAAYRIALTPQGDVLSSEGLAQQLHQRLTALGTPSQQAPSGRGRGGPCAQAIVWLVGGPHGIAPTILEQADWSVSLGALTWPHPLVRLLWIEQLYRTCRIQQGHAYHK
jgi:23S rRNA (pseudouridine1915-N3)-methyltransferase